MKDVHALLVGIDRYAQPQWNVPGPCANAIAIASWLIDAKVDPKNITLFALAFDETLDGELERLDKVGVAVRRQGDLDAIDTFWRATLPQRAAATSRLFVYWSGHGFADTDGTRVFVCSDYTRDGLNNRVINSTGLLRHLRGSAYQRFCEQIFMADVCAVHENVPMSYDKNLPPKPAGQTRQVAYYASPEGTYARGDNGRGVFTQIALDVLGKLTAWPSHRELRDAMDASFEQHQKRIFKVAYGDEESAFSERRVGTPVDAGRLSGSVYDLLNLPELSDHVFRPHFLRTASDLGMPGLTSAQGLTGMINELVSLRDADSPDRVSYGLLQFLLRLRQEPMLSERIDTWLVHHAGSEGNQLANLRRKLADEAATKIVLVEVGNDAQDEIDSYEVTVRACDLLPMPDASVPQRIVKGWAEFASHLLADIDGLKERHQIADFQIQFLVNPPLFDCPFHSIVLAAGSTLGEERVVLLRHRDRVRSSSRVLRAAWNRYAEALRPITPRAMPLVPIASQPGAGGVAAGVRGLCYTSFLLARPSNGPGNRPEKQTLLRLLRSGVPYVYWLHSLPSPDALSRIEEQIAGWLRQTDSLDQLPSLFTTERGSGNGFATEATLLWDDPLFNPFSSTKG